MNRKERVYALRNDPKVHYNCAQSVLIPFAAECGLSEEMANRVAANFGGGMKVASVCGAVTGAVMVLGLMGYGEEETRKLIRTFREKNGCLDCAALLKAAHERGEEKKQHCDRMIDDCVSLLEELAGK